MKIRYPAGATPLEPDALEQLIPTLATQGDLNRAEAQNIASAMEWARSNPQLRHDLLSVSGLLRLHREMFGDVWKWAGRFRLHQTNLGDEPSQIPTKTQALCDDIVYWVDHHTYPWPELAVRFHHRLVSIHPFVNGNGRHARLAADLLLQYNGHGPLPWGGQALVEESSLRREYIAALQEADRDSYERLVRFAESQC